MVVEIDHDVRDRNVEPNAHAFHDAALEPVRLPRRVRRDDDLGGMERPHGVLDRDERVTVPDPAARLRSRPIRVEQAWRPSRSCAAARAGSSSMSTS